MRKIVLTLAAIAAVGIALPVASNSASASSIDNAPGDPMLVFASLRSRKPVKFRHGRATVICSSLRLRAVSQTLS